MSQATDDDKQADHHQPQPESKKFKRSVLIHSDEMDDIIMGSKFSDKHVGLAQDLLKAQFQNVNGLECTLMRSKNLAAVQSEDTIQNKFS